MLELNGSEPKSTIKPSRGGFQTRPYQGPPQADRKEESAAAERQSRAARAFATPERAFGRAGGRASVLDPPRSGTDDALMVIQGERVMFQILERW